MSKNYMQEIKNRILSSEDGSVFSTSDFADIADTNTVRSALYRLVKDNTVLHFVSKCLTASLISCGIKHG